jgi:hypothetical protein
MEYLLNDLIKFNLNNNEKKNDNCSNINLKKINKKLIFKNKLTDNEKLIEFEKLKF